MASTPVPRFRSSRAAALGLVLTLTAGLTLGHLQPLRGKDTPAPAKRGERPKAAPAPEKPSIPEQSLVINSQLTRKWKEKKITPSARTSEYGFIRRASLDIIGRVATPEEI